ncbi:MAG: hypothetical protein BWY15_02449 [Firmicutes bacterium ADurb.Bin193]|nr:MAG: hypothetical protein BWY15_02449 [Firmicutes bacterium ADurb.Bin193]
MKNNKKIRAPETICVEEDQPPHKEGAATHSVMSPSKVDEYEKRLNNAEKAQRLWLKDFAVHLIVCCLGALMVLWVTDTILINLGRGSSSFQKEMFEYLKLVISTLIGFAFSSKLNNS